jgi:hypothetical protein
VVACAARLLEWPVGKVCREAGIPLLLESSVKKALDADWNKARQRTRALQILIQQLDCLVQWLRRVLPEHLEEEPLAGHLETLEQLRGQYLEPDPDGGGVRIRQAVAQDRRVSVEDGEMRHGRKSQSKRFNSTSPRRWTWTASCCAPSPRPIGPRQRSPQSSKKTCNGREWGLASYLYIDRGYIKCPVVESVLQQRGEVLSKPWAAQKGELLPLRHLLI